MRKRKLLGLNGNKRNGTRNRRFCDCGNLATVMLGNAKICERCYRLDKKQ